MFHPSVRRSVGRSGLKAFVPNLPSNETSSCSCLLAHPLSARAAVGWTGDISVCVFSLFYLLLRRHPRRATRLGINLPGACSDPADRTDYHPLFSTLRYVFFFAVNAAAPTAKSQVATLRASQVASSRRQSATLLVLVTVAVAVAVAAGVMKGVYGYDHGDVPSFALGLAAAVVPALLVWALPHLTFVPRRRGRRRRTDVVAGPSRSPGKQLLQ